MATATRRSRAVSNAKARSKAKAKQVAKPEPAPKAKPKFVAPTEEEREASDQKFYEQAQLAGLAIDNPRTGRRLSRFIIQAHLLSQYWPSKPMTAAAISELVTKRSGIKITEGRVLKQTQ